MQRFYFFNTITEMNTYIAFLKIIPAKNLARDPRDVSLKNSSLLTLFSSHYTFCYSKQFETWQSTVNCVT